MSLIVPYDTSLFCQGGAFISPDGRILHVKDDHETFCEEYLKTIMDKEILNLLNTYLKYSKTKSLSDFFVLVLAYDKVETMMYNTISTSSRQPHIRLYNYYLMDWNINVYEKLYYNESTNKYDIINPYLIGLDPDDTEACFEIENIKRRTLVNERNLFFK